MVRTGTIGQIKGPFEPGANLAEAFGAGNAIKFGISIGEKDYMKLGSFRFRINNGLTINTMIHVGKSFIYEVDGPVVVTELVFPEGAPASTIIDFVVADTE